MAISEYTHVTDLCAETKMDMALICARVNIGVGNKKLFIVMKNENVYSLRYQNYISVEYY